jgi:hypothetical protein
MRRREKGEGRKETRKKKKMGCRRRNREKGEGWRREAGEKRIGIQNGEAVIREKEEKIEREGGCRLEKQGEGKI